MSVRRADGSDWEVVRALRLDALTLAPDAFGSRLWEERDRAEAWWRRRLDGPGTTLLGLLDGSPCGLALVEATREDAAVAGLYSMWVAPDARGRGVGDALMVAAIEVARARGFTRIVLDVGDDNAPAIALYARHGFVPTGRTSTLPAPRQHVAEHERALLL